MFGRMDPNIWVSGGQDDRSTTVSLDIDGKKRECQTASLKRLFWPRWLEVVLLMINWSHLSVNEAFFGWRDRLCAFL